MSSAIIHLQQTMASRDICRFFDLPAELRNAIYEFATYTGEAVKPKDGLILCANNAPLCNLLLVNRQFSGEYVEAVKKITFLGIKDNGEQQFGLPSFPPALEGYKIRHAICVRNVPEDYEFKHHDEWIQEVESQGLAERLSVKFFLVHVDGEEHTHLEGHEIEGFEKWSHGEAHRAIKRYLARLVGLGIIQELKLYYLLSSDKRDRAVIFEAEEHLLETWTKDRGWELPS